jgi:hypothetical protein
LLTDTPPGFSLDDAADFLDGCDFVEECTVKIRELCLTEHRIDFDVFTNVLVHVLKIEVFIKRHFRCSKGGITRAAVLTTKEDRVTSN